MHPDFEGHANQILGSMLARVMENGIEAAPRGRKTRELLHQVTLVPDPRKRVLTIGNRRANPFFQIAETVWILAGASDAEWILHFNKQLEQFLDPCGPEFVAPDGSDTYKHFHAPYGERMRHYGESNKFGAQLSNIDQLVNVIQELRNDVETRRAVMVFGNPLFDSPHIKTNDRPCNVAFAFKLRDNRLHMTTFNRSNDVVLGLTFTNIAQFTTIQEVIAATLGVELGPYYHYSDSLHVYEDDAIATRLSLGAGVKDFDIYEYVKPTPMRLSPHAITFPERLYASRSHRGGELYDAIDCDYWRSAALMIKAWDHLSDYGASNPTAHIDAMNLLERVPAEDWKIAAFEFLVRWADNRKLYSVDKDISVILDGYHTRVVDWVFNSREAVK